MGFISDMFGGGSSGSSTQNTSTTATQNQAPGYMPYDFNTFLTNYLNNYVQNQNYGNQSPFAQKQQDNYLGVQQNSPSQKYYQSLYYTQPDNNQSNGSVLGGTFGRMSTGY